MHRPLHITHHLPTANENQKSTQKQAVFMSETAAPTPAPAPPPVAADAPKPKKICCACPDTRKLRDECMVHNGEEKCAVTIEAHKKCLRSEGFDVRAALPRCTRATLQTDCATARPAGVNGLQSHHLTMRGRQPSWNAASLGYGSHAYRVDTSHRSDEPFECAIGRDWSPWVTRLRVL